MTDLTINAKTVAAARTALVRLNGQLAELRVEEQRCAIKRSRLEAEHARVHAFVDMLDEIERCNGMDIKPLVRIVPFDPQVPDGVKMVLPAEAEEPTTISEVAERVLAEQHARKQIKPEGLPTVAAMIVTVLAEAARRGRDSLAPREIRAAIRKRWWPDAPHAVVSSRAWRMGQLDLLRKIGPAGRGRRYGLNSAKGRQPAHEDAL